MSRLYALFRQLNILFKAFFHLLYPDLCIHCKRELTSKHPYLCYSCTMRLKLIKWQKKAAYNIVYQSLNPNLVIYICALYKFEESEPIQTLLHELKYRFNRGLGLHYGKELGAQYSSEKRNHPIEILVPVPVHARKKFDRGYNQSELLAKGISTTTGIPVCTKVLKKIKNTKTQTQLNKTERLLNTKGSFSVSEEIMNYKTIAIVDDVVTTGATINAICQALMQKNNNLQITIFSLALAQQE